MGKRGGKGFASPSGSSSSAGPPPGPAIPPASESPNAARPSPGLSRRDFLKVTGAAMPAGVLVSDGLLGTYLPARTAGGVGPGPVPVTVQVNGRRHTLEIEPRVTLLDALRDFAGLTGAKRVCDRGTCGACTVLVDGKAVYACSMLAIEAQGHEITTIEGLVPEGELHAVSAAFVENDAQQCGFCTPGFVVAAKAFLNRHPNATEADVMKGLGGNLCRCGTYVGVRKAVVDAARRISMR